MATKITARERRQMVCEDLTNAFIESLDEIDSEGRWVRPWVMPETIYPINVDTGHVFTGQNAFILSFIAALQGKSPYWSTFKGWKNQGRQVSKGNTATYAFRPLFRKERGEDGVERQILVNFKALPYFSFSDTEPIEDEGFEGKVWEPPVKKPLRETMHLEDISNLIRGMETHLKGGVQENTTGRAFYAPDPDFISVPPQVDFTSDEAWAATMCHEIIHSTGHSSRKNRFGPDFSDKASESYAREELVAEIGAAFVCGLLGVTNEKVDEQHVRYLDSWREDLSKDPKLILAAATKALAAVEWINTNAYQIEERPGSTAIESEGQNSTELENV